MTTQATKQTLKDFRIFFIEYFFDVIGLGIAIIIIFAFISELIGGICIGLLDIRDMAINEELYEKIVGLIFKYICFIILGIAAIFLLGYIITLIKSIIYNKKSKREKNITKEIFSKGDKNISNLDESIHEYMERHGYGGDKNIFKKLKLECLMEYYGSSGPYFNASILGYKEISLPYNFIVNNNGIIKTRIFGESENYMLNYIFSYNNGFCGWLIEKGYIETDRLKEDFERHIKEWLNYDFTKALNTNNENNQLKKAYSEKDYELMLYIILNIYKTPVQKKEYLASVLKY